MTDAIAKDIEAVSRIDAVPSILEIACKITGLRFAAVARVTDSRWIACAVRDEIAFGLEQGGELDIKSTICDEIRQSGSGVIIDHVSRDPVFRDHHTPRQYGFESYISIPIIKRDGSFFGTLCALDPLPAKLSEAGTIATFENFARLIGLQLDLQEDLERKEARLAEADTTAEVRERFIAILGHDLRNPIAAIDAGTALLSKLDGTPKSQFILGQMSQSVRRARLLIDDLLDFARGRLGSGLTLKRRPVGDLAAPIRQVIAELQLVHPDHPVELDARLDEIVTCDIERITQLLSNLVGNAITHGEAGKPVRVHAASASGRFTLSVANEGPPIAQDALPRLFQPFTEPAAGGSISGLGLGLFIASEIAKAHDGALEVMSDTRETRFTLTMPCTC